MMVKSPHERPSSHQGKRGQCLSTGASLCGDLPELTLTGLLSARVPGIPPGPWLPSRRCPRGPCDQDRSRGLLAPRPSLVACLEPRDFFFSEISLPRCFLRVSTWRPSALSALFLPQRPWLFLWLSLTSHSQPTPRSLHPRQLRTELPLEQTPAPSAGVAAQAGFLQCSPRG